MITYKNLWHFAQDKQTVSLSELSDELQQCLRDGDNLFDHYGNRTPFVFLETNGLEMLMVELESKELVKPSIVLNCTGGYGAGVLGGNLSFLLETVSDGILKAPIINDEHHSIERLTLVKNIKGLIAEHTCTEVDDWEISFTSTGTEAVDLAIQMTLLNDYELASDSNQTEKDVILACHGAWHGWGVTANQLLDRKQFTGGIPRIENYEVVFMHYGDVESLHDVFSRYRGRIKSVIVEGILGDGGVVLADYRWWQELAELSAGEDALIIDDEILTGFRTGATLALPKGILPSCITLGKALGFGLFPLSAVIWNRNKVTLRSGIGIRTFNARPFQARVVNKALEYIQTESLNCNADYIGKTLLSGLKAIQQTYPEVIKDVRGRGALIGMELSRKFARKGRFFRDELIRHGALSEVESGMLSTNIPREKRIHETIRITPPLMMNKDEMDVLLQSIERCCATLDLQP